MDNNWSDRLRQRMEAHSEPPPDGLWDGIERAMGSAAGVESAAADVRARRRRLLFSGAGFAAAAAITALLLLVDVPPVDVPPVGEERIERVYAAVEEISEEKAGVTETPKRILARKAVAARGSEEFVIESEPETPPAETPPSARSANPETPDISETPEAPARAATSAPTVSPTIPSNISPVIPRPKSKKWRAGLYASNVTLTSSSGFGGKKYADAIGSSPIWSADLTSDMASEKNSHLVIIDDRILDVKHRLPLTVGVSVGYGLGRRWNLTSGLTYTMLSSRFRSILYSKEQVLHYIGIPLSVDYSVWNGHGLSVYLSAGGLVEKNVAGTLTVKNLQDNAGNGSGAKHREKAPADRLQWSVNGAIGLQYDFVKSVGLYVEPGVNYYLDNRSGVENVYKAKPVNFGLRLGLRVSL